MRAITTTKNLAACRNYFILLLAFGAILWANVALIAQSAQSLKQKDTAIAVRFTDIRKSAGITFLQDSTQTEEKYYLETMGTGVAWIDYDHDGLMDLFFAHTPPPAIYKPPHPFPPPLPPLN